jgi:hypothetical protein
MLKNAGRHWNNWALSSENDGRAIQILIPSSELRNFTEEQPKQRTWIPPAPENSMVVISIFISRNGAEEPWPAYKEGALLVGEINTPNRKAWVVYKNQQVPEDFERYILIGRVVVEELPGAEAILSTEDPRGCICGNNSSGDNFMLKVATPSEPQ